MKNAQMQYDGASSTETWGRALSTWLGLVPAIMDDAKITSWENICNNIDAISPGILPIRLSSSPSILVCRIRFYGAVAVSSGILANPHGVHCRTEMSTVRF